MARNLDEDLVYCPPGTCLYNIRFVGGVFWTRVTSHALKGVRQEQINYVWIVDEKRRATPTEIQQLCVS